MGGGPDRHAGPLPEEPTEELPVAPPGPVPAPWDIPLLRMRYEDGERFRRIAAAIRSHRRSSASGAVAITAADRRLYAALERLEQPN